LTKTAYPGVAFGPDLQALLVLHAFLLLLLSLLLLVSLLLLNFLLLLASLYFVAALPYTRLSFFKTRHYYIFSGRNALAD
jgi:hypothetical protein